MERRTIRITRGLPGSGKSTFAKKFVADSNCKTQRVNRDDLRHMMNGYVLTWTNQAVILEAEKSLMRICLQQGFDLILDNMFIKAIDMQNLTKFCREFESENPNITINIVIVDFTDIPLSTCIERDATRPKPTGESVIRDQHEIFVEQNTEFMKYYIEYNERNK